LAQISRTSRALIPRQEYEAGTSFAAALIVGFLDNPSKDGGLLELWRSLGQQASSHLKK